MKSDKLIKSKSPRVKAQIDQLSNFKTEIGKPSDFREIFNSNNSPRIIRELYSIIEYCTNDPKEPIFEDQVNSYISCIEELESKDPIEANLIMQMLVTHDLFMKCANRANAKGQNQESLDGYIKGIMKLSRVYTSQLKAYISYKNQGLQKVKVEHIHISEGGQAVFGNIDARKSCNQGGGVKNE